MRAVLSAGLFLLLPFAPSAAAVDLCDGQSGDSWLIGYRVDEDCGVHVGLIDAYRVCGALAQPQQTVATAGPLTLYVGHCGPDATVAQAGVACPQKTYSLPGATLYTFASCSARLDSSCTTACGTAVGRPTSPRPS